jgi:hypothetical protein
VRRLLDKGKRDQALALAEDVLKTEAGDADALEIALGALEGRDAPAGAAYARRLIAARLARPDLPAAADALRRLLGLLPQPKGAEPEARQFLAALSPADGPAVDAARRMLSRVRGADPVAHAWLAGYIAARTALGPILMPPPGALGPDDPLPIRVGLGQPPTARQLVEAVARGDAAPVAEARAALAALESGDPDTHARVWAALEQTASEEPSALAPLRRAPRGPAVVDGSNVAWFDQESLAHGQPRLRPLLAIRRTLWARGFFPVVLYADANLPYFIDDPAGLRRMRDRRELTLVDAGTVADEVLLRTAKTLGAPLVTNDRMTDWDPEREVPKVGYAISMGGEAHLLSEA